MTHAICRAAIPNHTGHQNFRASSATQETAISGHTPGLRRPNLGSNMPGVNHRPGANISGHTPQSLGSPTLLAICQAPINSHGKVAGDMCGKTGGHFFWACSPAVPGSNFACNMPSSHPRQWPDKWPVKFQGTYLPTNANQNFRAFGCLFSCRLSWRISKFAQKPPSIFGNSHGIKGQVPALLAIEPPSSKCVMPPFLATLAARMDGDNDDSCFVCLKVKVAEGNNIVSHPYIRRLQR